MPEAAGARRIAGTVILKGTIALILIQLGYQQAEILSAEFRRRIAKHPFRRRVHRLDFSDGGVEGDDAVRHGIENRLHPRGAVAQRLLRGIFLGDVAEHQHGADHDAVAVANGRATVGDVTLDAIAGDQYGVVGQPLNRAMLQCGHDRNGGGLAGFFVDDVKHLGHRPAAGLRLRPAGKLFGHGIQARHARMGVGGQHGIADGAEGHGEFFLVVPQGEVGLLQLFARLLLRLEQVLGFEMHQIFEAMLGFPINQIGKRQRQCQRNQAADDDDGKQKAQAGLISSFTLRQHGCFNLDVGLHLGPDRIHHPLALATAHNREHGRHVIGATQFDYLRQFRHFGVQQRRHGVQMFLGGADQRLFTQLFQLVADAGAHRQIRLQKSLVTGERITALPGLGIFQVGQQIARALDERLDMRPRLGGVFNLPEGPERYKGSQRHQQNGSRQRSPDLISGFQGKIPLPS